jgi:hypothetical protein
VSWGIDSDEYTPAECRATTDEELAEKASKLNLELRTLNFELENLTSEFVVHS